MANVIFKRGLQASLPAVGSAVDGVFYFTTDTNRLYLGKTGGDRVLLNQTVEILDDLDSLTRLSNAWTTNQAKLDHKNDFYYISSENILCVWDGTTWQQINPDDDTKVDSIAFSTSAASNVASALLTVNNKNSYDNSTSTKTDTLTITGAGSVSATASGKNITLTGDTYTLTQPAASQVATQSVDLLLNCNDGSVAAKNSKITLRSADTDALEFQATASGIDVIAHNTTLSGQAAGVAVSVNNGTLSVTATDSDSNSKTGTASNIGVALTGANGSGDGYLPLINAGAGATAGAVYSKDAIDSMLGGLDGMTYKGVVGNGVNLPTSNIKNGDTYVVIDEDFVPAQNTPIESNTAASMALGLKVGDMFIAKGTEGSDGNITSQTLEWTYIPAGNDSLSDVTYSAVINTTSPENSILLQNGSHTTIAKLDLRAGTDVALSSVASGTNNNTLTTTINHATISTTDNTTVNNTKLPSEQASDSELTAGGASFAAITGLTVSNGHITAIERGKFVPVTYDLATPAVTQLTSMDGLTNSGSNSAQVQVKLKDSNNTQKTSSNIKLYSSSIKLTPDSTNADQLNMNIEWGTF